MNLIERAQDFAHRAHDSIQQKRKYSGLPYWVHTDDVAERGKGALERQGIYQPDIIERAVAGYHMHDVWEDVFPELKRQGRMDEYIALQDEFNAFPALSKQITIELTDVFVKEAYPQLNRDERHERERERLGGISVLGKTGKLSDLIGNTISIVAEDKDFARVYLKEKFALLPYLADGAPELLQIASMQVVAGFHQLGLDLPIMR